MHACDNSLSPLLSNLRVSNIFRLRSCLNALSLKPQDNLSRPEQRGHAETINILKTSCGTRHFLFQGQRYLVEGDALRPAQFQVGTKYADFYQVGYLCNYCLQHSSTVLPPAYEVDFDDISCCISSVDADCDLITRYICGPYVVTLLDQTPTFEWNMARLLDREAQLKKHVLQ